MHLIDWQNAPLQPVLFRGRQESFEYYVEHVEDKFCIYFAIFTIVLIFTYIVTNADGAVNYQVFTSSTATFHDRGTWTSLLSHKEDTKIEDIDIFKVWK